MSTTLIAEPLLVSREQLDAAIAIVRETAASFGIDPTIEADIYIDPEIASEPPVQLLTIHVTSEPVAGHDTVDQLRRAARGALRQAGLYVPATPIDLFMWPEW